MERGVSGEHRPHEVEILGIDCKRITVACASGFLDRF
jgi:hypothetical protein